MRNNESLIDNKSACFVADQTVVKKAKGNWVHRPSSVEAASKVDADSIAKTRKLLDGAIALAWRDVKTNRRPPALTPTRWVWRLAGAYHSSRFTTQLMEKAAQRFAASGRNILAEWAVEKAKEEAGHDRLALLDIQSMGYDPEAVVEALVPSAATTVVDYLSETVQKSDPICCVGFFYTAERLGTFQGEQYIQRVEGLLPPGTRATRWLRIHSAVGAEVQHVEETVKVVTELSSQERISTAEACYETAVLRFTPPNEGYILDEELQHILKPLESPKRLQAKSDFQLLTK